MGWTFGYGSTRSDIIKEVSRDWSNENLSCKTVAKCCAGNNLWMVVERHNALKNETYRFIALYLLRRSKDGWGYKDMDESCGPNAVNCPMKYLKLAPSNELNNKGYSLEWRKRVQGFWETKHKQQEYINTLKTGTEIKYGYLGTAYTFLHKRGNAGLLMIKDGICYGGKISKIQLPTI